MSREDSQEQDSEVSFSQHPALRNYSRTGFMAKHVLKNVLKWGAIGAVAAVAGIAVMALAYAWSIAWIAVPAAAVISWFAPEFAASQAGGLALSTVTAVAPIGAAIGAAIGGIVAISSASEAADAEEDRLVAKYEQREARRDRMSALERRRDEQRSAMDNQASAMRIPNHQIPRGRQGQHGGQAHP